MLEPPLPKQANRLAVCGRSGQAGNHANGQTCSRADRRAIMLLVMRGAIARMGRGLPDKHRVANPIRQGIPNAGSPDPDRLLALTASQNRAALWASSNEGGRDSGAQSNRAGWPGLVREGGTRFLIRRSKRRTGDAVGGGHAPGKIARKSRKRRRRWGVCINKPLEERGYVVWMWGRCRHVLRHPLKLSLLSRPAALATSLR